MSAMLQLLSGCVKWYWDLLQNDWRLGPCSIAAPCIAEISKVQQSQYRPVVAALHCVFKITGFDSCVGCLAHDSSGDNAPASQ